MCSFVRPAHCVEFFSAGIVTGARHHAALAPAIVLGVTAVDVAVVLAVVDLRGFFLVVLTAIVGVVCGVEGGAVDWRIGGHRLHNAWYVGVGAR